MKNILFLFLLLSGTITAQDNSAFFEQADDFFSTYVENGKVKYAEIKQNPKALNDLLALAKTAEVSPEEEAEYKAFWINAYNLAVINGIIKEYPVGSPMDVVGFFNKKKHSLGQQSVTLDQIEHDLLFENFPDEERFHFVLVCAAKSCPPLISEAYKPATLEEQMQRQTENALNDPQFIRVNGNKILFSEIMKWFNEDFTGDGSSLIQYANRFRKNKLPANAEVGFYKYDWDLNDF